MIELGKYAIYVSLAYGTTFGLLISLVLQTLLDFTRTKKKLDEISIKSYRIDDLSQK